MYHHWKNDRMDIVPDQNINIWNKIVNCVKEVNFVQEWDDRDESGELLNTSMERQESHQLKNIMFSLIYFKLSSKWSIASCEWVLWVGSGLRERWYLFRFFLFWKSEISWTQNSKPDTKTKITTCIHGLEVRQDIEYTWVWKTLSLRTIKIVDGLRLQLESYSSQ